MELNKDKAKTIYWCDHDQMYEQQTYQYYWEELLISAWFLHVSIQVSYYLKQRDISQT